MNKAGNAADCSRGFYKGANRLAGGYIDNSGADLKAGLAQYFCGCIAIFLPEIGQENMFPGAYPPGNCLAN